MILNILELINIYFYMKDGDFINNHLNYFVLYEDEIEVRVRYRTIKHIVESRKKDGYDIEKILELFKIALIILKNNNYNISLNDKGDSYILIENNATFNALIIVLEIKLEDDAIHIKTLFFRAVTKTIKNKNLHFNK